MTTLVDHARSMVAYTVWADIRILSAAEGIDEGQFGQIQSQLQHMLETQRYWYSNWIGGELVRPNLKTLVEARDAYDASHGVLKAYVDALTHEEWDRVEQWWLKWGVENRMALGESITQLFYHGVQHRSEVAVLLSEWGHSPGDLDYLTFLDESGRSA